MSSPVDLRGGAVVVTGSTRGLGKAIGLAFARAGASVFLTHRWSSVSDEELAAEFAAAGLAAPHVVESDAADPDATRALMARVHENGAPLVALVSNVAFGKVTDPADPGDLSDLKRSSLELTLGYSAWPLVDLLQAVRAETGRYPRYAVAISSDGPDVCHPGYELIGASKAVLETLCRYLALRLRGEGVRVNALRPGFLDSASSRATFGDAAIDEIGRRAAGLLLDPAVIANACVALCSGLMDGVTGQVIDVDEGWSLVSPISYLTGRETPRPFPQGG